MLIGKTARQWARRAGQSPVAHHVDFLTRLKGARRERVRVDAVGRVLRRAQTTVMHHTALALNVAVRTMHRMLSMHRMTPALATLQTITVQHTNHVRQVVERQSALIHRIAAARDSVAEESRGPDVVLRREPTMQPPSAPRMTMVMTKSAAVVAARTVAATLSAQRDEPRTRNVTQIDAPRMSDRQDAARLPDHELSRVTDHVIQQLDRRVLSYRERTGRL
jgi:hypothetical protein